MNAYSFGTVLVVFTHLTVRNYLQYRVETGTKVKVKRKAK